MPWDGTIVSHINPPVRADHVGSLLRPKILLEARQPFESHQIPKEEVNFAPTRIFVTGKLRQVEDIQKADFEFRRSNQGSRTLHAARPDVSEPAVRICQHVRLALEHPGSDEHLGLPTDPRPSTVPEAP